MAAYFKYRVCRNNCDFVNTIKNTPEFRGVFGFGRIRILPAVQRNKPADDRKPGIFPELSEKALHERLQARHAAHPQRRAAAFFVGLLPRLLAQCAIKACGIRQDDALDPRRIDALARQLHAWKLPVQGSRGFAEAQVTIGGIDTADFDSASMQSWMVPGLYACGEVLDIDGDCGGYNLQWAWSSGRLAAVSAVSESLNV